MAAGPGSGPPGAGGLRASSADREHAIAVLKSAFVQGRLAMDEFDARLGRALTSRTSAELAALTADLPAVPAGSLPLPVSGARRRAGRWAAAIVAVVLLGCAGLAVWGRPGDPAGRPGPVAGLPRYYVQQAFGQRPPGAVVRATATGAVTATVRSPWPQAVITAIAAGGDQTFFMVCQRSAGGGFSGARIYRFRVTAAGRVSGYSLVPGGELAGLQAGRLAVSANDEQIALTTEPAGATGPAATSSIMVINTRTGARARWDAPPAVPGTMTLSAGDLSFTADGRELAYLATPRCVHGPCTPTGSGEEVRVVSPAAQGGSLASSRLLLRQSSLAPLGTSYLDGAIISPDGSHVTVLVMNTPAGGPPINTISVVQVSATTGRQTGVSFRMDTGSGFSYRLFGADPSGRHLLLDAGPPSGAVNGWIDRGQLIPLTPRDGDNVFAEAW